MIKRKDKILFAALELLEAGGTNNITTRKLAENQGVSEPALYRQFKNKNEITRKIIETYGSYDLRINNTIIENKMNSEDGIIYYVNRYAELYTNYSELSLVLLSTDLYFYQDDLKKQMNDIINNRKEFLTNFFSSQPLKNINLSPELTANLILDLLEGEVRRWVFSGHSFNLQNHLMDYFKRVIL